MEELKYVLIPLADLKQIKDDLAYLKKSFDAIEADKHQTTTLTTKEVMKLLNCGRTTIHYRVKTGVLKATKHGNRLGFQKTDVLEFMKEHQISLDE